MVRLSLALILLLTGSQVPLIAADLSSPSRIEALPNTLVWRTKSTAGDRMGVSLEMLYVFLYNTQQLPVRVYSKDTGRMLEQILRDEELFYGTSFPVGIDSVLCDLNRNVCSRELRPADDLDQLTEHVGGYAKSPGNWRNHENMTLVLPIFHIKKIVDFAIQRKQLGLSGSDYVRKFVNKYHLECESLYRGLSCDELVKRFNSHAPDTLAPDVESKAILPKRELRVEIPIWFASSVQRKSTAEWHSPDWATKLHDMDPDITQAVGVKDFFFAWGNASLNAAASSEPNYIDQRELLAAISHPYNTNDELPQMMREPIRVGVLDNRLDVQHCDLSNSIEIPYPVNSQWPQTLERVDNCGEMITGSLKEYHHGTHVVGLIAALLNQEAIVGLNPYAKIVFHAVNLDDFRDPGKRDDLAFTIISAMSNTSIINVSLDYGNDGGGADRFSDAVSDGALSGRLVVVAAGNDGRTFDDNTPCGLRPACFKFKNVISVVGLDRDLNSPSFWGGDGRQSSNRGAQFDIAAIADNVLSIAAMDHIGYASGTSQAAPQVTAAASLLYSIYEHLYKDSIKTLFPQHVKNRLMYTADIFQPLLKNVFSGRLNIERALAVAEDQFVIVGDDNDDIRQVVRGQVTVFGVKKGEDYETCTPDRWDECKTSVIYCELPDGEILDINVSRIRRMIRSEETKQYIIFYNEKPYDRASRLLRITNCKLKSGSHRVVVDFGKYVFKIEQIRDYASSMF